MIYNIYMCVYIYMYICVYIYINNFIRGDNGGKKMNMLL